MEDVVLLDTVMLFDFLANKGAAEETEKIMHDGRAAVSAITVYELFRGVESEEHREQRNTLLSFLHVLELNTQIAKTAGLLFTNIRKKGLVIDNEDILIAATGLHYRIPLFTLNMKHFNEFAGLQFYT